ncbi:MAG TPA: protein-export chaperone SecB [Alistipes finegoldii]|uniref:protein-export chaperone SecB n=1 Tax=Alistipes finegoldii TaxID=214856 RepID=UPI001DBB628A|nr:protein-export chaperone SecB [Alistipes finegoldii]HJG72199.1 protein-export chaperone SecB [Alistipes finegoldii]
MTNEIAKFRFAGFSIRKSAIEIKNHNAIAPNMSLNLDLAGEHIVNECRYNLYMKVGVQDKSKSVKANIEVIGYYEFDNDCKEQELSDYFYINAPAILFPYVRAYLATLSTLSGLSNPIMIPTMNLTKFAEQLKENTTAR